MGFLEAVGANAAWAFIASIIRRLGKGSGSGEGRQAKSTYWIGRPRNLGSGFVGRQAELRDVAQAFKKRRAVVLSGGPGVGPC